MSYLALARKYRPQTFDELIGQEFVSTSLKNAVNLKRVSHAYLFTGARGVGKTSAARILAKSVNCLNPVDNNPCNVCENCLEITEGTAIDVMEIDGASNRGIDDIRQLRETVRFIPVKCPYKIYIIDEVHMITDAASNALLKTLEEPPSYVIFILATTEAHKVLATIKSRCQSYIFKKLSFEDMKTRLKAIFDTENIRYDSSALNLVVRQSDGCMRDALSFSDQVISYTSGNMNAEAVAELLGVSSDPLIAELYASILKEDTAGLEGLITNLADNGVSYTYAAERMITHSRNLLFLSSGAIQLKKELTVDENAFYENALKSVSTERLFALFQLLQKLHKDLKYSSFARYTFEFGLFKAANLSRVVPLPAMGAITPSPQGPAIKKPEPAKPEPTGFRSVKEEVKQAIKVEMKSETRALNTKEQAWHELLNKLKADAPGLAASLTHGVVEDFSAEHVAISFPKEKHFQYSRIIRPENMSILLGFLKARLSPDIKVEITGGDEDKKGLADKKQELESLHEKRLREETAATPVVKSMLDLFDMQADDIKILKKE